MSWSMYWPLKRWRTRQGMLTKRECWCSSDLTLPDWKCMIILSPTLLLCPWSSFFWKISSLVQSGSPHSKSMSGYQCHKDSDWPKATLRFVDSSSERVRSIWWYRNSRIPCKWTSSKLNWIRFHPLCSLPFRRTATYSEFANTRTVSKWQPVINTQCLSCTYSFCCMSWLSYLNRCF